MSQTWHLPEKWSLLCFGRWLGYKWACLRRNHVKNGTRGNSRREARGNESGCQSCWVVMSCLYLQKPTRCQHVSNVWYPCSCSSQTIINLWLSRSHRSESCLKKNQVKRSQKIWRSKSTNLEVFWGLVQSSVRSSAEEKPLVRIAC